MKYLVAAVFLISTALAYPVGENEGEPSVPLVISDYASVAKSDESGEVHSHEHNVEAQSDVSHEHDSPKVEHDSSESSEESGSSESAEKQQEQAQPEKEIKEKPLLDEKVEHQAQPSEIIQSEVAHPQVQDPVKLEHPENVEHPAPAVLSDPVPSLEPAHNPEVVPHSDESQAQKEEVKPSDETPKTIPAPEAPTPLSDEHAEAVKPEVKEEVAVVQSDPVGVVQPKSADEPELKEEQKPAEEKKPAEESLLSEKKLPAEIEKPVEEKPKSVEPQESIIPEAKAADPVPAPEETVKDVVKPAGDIASDELPLPQPEATPAKEELPKKEPEPETLPEKLPEPSSSS